MKQETGFVFPGQGSQKTGMLSDLGEHDVVRDTFSEASRVLSYDLWELVQHGDESELARTSVTQPAILTASVAIWRLWLEQGGWRPTLMAGHSLGEYSALVCSGVLAFNEAVGLVQKRGEFMQSAVPEGVGGMAAIVGLEDRQVSDLCEQATSGDESVVEAVNFNAPGQVVIAGHREALERATALCKEAGAKRALVLPVSAPFHSRLMRPAAEKFAGEVQHVRFVKPAIPVLQNHGLQASDDPAVIRDNLIRQIDSPVPWVDTINLFAEQGIRDVFELGPGKVLCGLIRRIQPELTALSVNDAASLKAALEKAGQVD